MSRSIYLPSVAVTLAILALAIDCFARTLVGSCAAVMALLLVLAARQDRIAYERRAEARATYNRPSPESN